MELANAEQVKILQVTIIDTSMSGFRQKQSLFVSVKQGINYNKVDYIKIHVWPVRITTANQKLSKSIASLTSIPLDLSITNLPLLLNLPISLDQHCFILYGYTIARHL